MVDSSGARPTLAHLGFWARSEAASAMNYDESRTKGAANKSARARSASPAVTQQAVWFVSLCRRCATGSPSRTDHFAYGGLS